MTRDFRAIAAFVAVGAFAALCSTPAGAQNSGVAAKGKPSQDSRSLNPQPEVPSRPPLAKGAKATGTDLHPTAKPLDASEPKALNPQPEVPSKTKKKTTKKKPEGAAKAP